MCNRDVIARGRDGEQPAEANLLKALNDLGLDRDAVAQIVDDRPYTTEEIEEALANWFFDRGVHEYKDWASDEGYIINVTPRIGDDGAPFPSAAHCDIALTGLTTGTSVGQFFREGN